jgi:lactoylglutathione lyase
MSSKFLGLRTAAYKVDDLDKAKAWYTKILGVAPYFDQPFYVGFNVGGYELGLQPVEEGDEGSGAGGLTVYWGVDDVDSTFDALLAEGATAAEQPTDVGDGIKVASVKDPWGNLFGIIYNPHFTLGS